MGSSAYQAAVYTPANGIARITLIDKRPLPPPWERLLQKLTQGGINIEERAEPEKTAKGDLGKLQRALLRGGNAEASGDGSLVVIRAHSDIQAAEIIASWLTSDGALKPVLVVPNGDRSLAGALAQCGASTLGIKSHSPSRPILQILPILLDLLWEPLDPHRLIEFLTLPDTPIPKLAARQLAEVVAVAPGIGGTPWNKKVADIETAWAKKTRGPRSDLMLRLLLTVWLDTPRFRQATGIPRHALLSLAERIITWAHPRCDNDDCASEMQILAGHAEQLYWIVETSPEERFSQPHLLQLVRMIQKITPATGEGAEAGYLSWVEMPDAIVGKAREILWWDFISANIPDIRRSPWSKEEVRFLAQKKVDVLEAENELTRLANSFTKPVFNAQDRLILVIPRSQNGADVAPHPFYDRIKIIFGNSLYRIELNANDWPKGSRLLPPLRPLPLRTCPVPQRFWRIEGVKLLPRQVESYSSLNELFYRPFKWVIKYKAEIDNASLQGINNTRTVMGTLAHRFFQEIFRPGQDLTKWKKDEVARMTDDTLAPLIRKEGCLLLLPGFEAQLASFVSKMKAAAWSMVCHIRDNGWRVGGTECVADGMLGNQPITGRIDLLLDGCQKSRAVVDLKWSGGKYRREELSENKALQLALYAHMLEHSGRLPHVAFFILSDAELIAPDGLGFINARVVTAPEGNSLASLIKQMELTWRWRWSQLECGIIEVPVDGTVPEPEFSVCTGALVMPEDPCDPGELLALVGWKEESHG